MSALYLHALLSLRTLGKSLRSSAQQASTGAHSRLAHVRPCVFHRRASLAVPPMFPPVRTAHVRRRQELAFIGTADVNWHALEAQLVSCQCAKEELRWLAEGGKLLDPLRPWPTVEVRERGGSSSQGPCC